jgi:hypothetical protein
MNRLQLGQRLVRECGISGTLSSTLNQTGSLARVVSWVDSAWEEIQNRHGDWEFLRSSNLLGLGASFATVAGQASYPLGTGAGKCGVTSAAFGDWDRETMRVYTTSVGTSNETFLDYIPYDVWRDAYMYGAMRSVQTRPVAFSIGPDKSICLGPPPNDLYTVTGDYYLAPTAMAADTDSPTGLPTQYHMAIVYKAMEYYGGYESAPEVLQRGVQGFNDLICGLEADYLTEMTFAGSLA